MHILILPTEILDQVLCYTFSSRRPKLQSEAAKLSRVCKAFAAVVARYIYSHCDIYLHAIAPRKYNNFKHGYWVRVGPPERAELSGFLTASEKLEAFRTHAGYVRFLTISTRKEQLIDRANKGKNVDHRLPEYSPSLSFHLNPLVSSFSKLKSLTLIDEDKFPIIPVELLSFLANLTKLSSLSSLSLQLRINNDYHTTTAIAPLIKALQYDPRPENLASHSSLGLQSLTIRLILESQGVNMPYGSVTDRSKCWFLDALTKILQPVNVSTLTDLQFLAHRGWNTFIQWRPGETVVSDKKLKFPNVQNLRMSLHGNSVDLFDTYFEVEPERIQTLELDKGVVDMVVPFAARFFNVHTVCLRGTDDYGYVYHLMYQRIKLRWSFVRELKDALERLKFLNIYVPEYGNKLPEDIVERVGKDFMRYKVKNLKYMRFWKWRRDYLLTEWEF